MLNFENLDKFYFQGVGKYGIPEILPVTEYPAGEFIPMNYAISEKRPEEKNVHCFVDDYQFARYWNQPDRYIEKLSRFRAVCSPDFSTYTDMPLVMQFTTIIANIGLRHTGKCTEWQSIRQYHGVLQRAMIGALMVSRLAGSWLFQALEHRQGLRAKSCFCKDTRK